MLLKPTKKQILEIEVSVLLRSDAANSHRFNIIYLFGVILKLFLKTLIRCSGVILNSSVRILF